MVFGQWRAAGSNGWLPYPGRPMRLPSFLTTSDLYRCAAAVPQIDWQYIIIDEAQRMKDRQSKLARDLDKFTGVMGMWVWVWVMDLNLK